jgi:hypothetical protein
MNQYATGICEFCDSLIQIDLLDAMGMRDPRLDNRAIHDLESIHEEVTREKTSYAQITAEGEWHLFCDCEHDIFIRHDVENHEDLDDDEIPF